MANWLERLVERLRREKPITPLVESAPEKPWCVYGHEPIMREGVYNFCYQPNIIHRMSSILEMSPRTSCGTSLYVALLEAATDGSLGIVVKSVSRSAYHRTTNVCLFQEPLSALTPYDVFNTFWRNLRRPIFPGLSETTLVFSNDDLPVLHREGGLELLAAESSLQKQ